MKASTGLSRLHELALRQRRLGLARTAATRRREAVRFAGGVLTVTLGRGRTTGGIIPDEKLAEGGWIENYCKVKDHLEEISEINRELLRRERAK
jgi:hypothetical protein